MFRERHESKVAEEFDTLLDDVIEDFEEAVTLHRERLEQLREALRDG